MSTNCFDCEDETFIVLINEEEQYSLWPPHQWIPRGWTVVEGVKGDQKTVLERIDKNWTDMRPKSLREWMAQQQQKKQAALPEP